MGPEQWFASTGLLQKRLHLSGWTSQQAVPKLWRVESVFNSQECVGLGWWGGGGGDKGRLSMALLRSSSPATTIIRPGTIPRCSQINLFLQQ